MLHYPHVQKKAQVELDAVVGHDRMPEYSDKESLPYLRALINEALRYAFRRPYHISLSYSPVMNPPKDGALLLS